jgi:ferredoxin
MALLINETCIACDACEPVCPNKAITAGTPIYVIDPDKCTECVGAEDEPQCRLVCPSEPGCIVQNPDYVRPKKNCWASTRNCTLDRLAIDELHPPLSGSIVKPAAMPEDIC